MKIDLNELNIHLKNYLDQLINITPQLEIFLKNIPSEYDFYIFGGWVRDALHNYFHNGFIKFNDIDIVINGPVNKIPFFDIKLNHYGGTKLEINNNLRIDFWELNNSIVFRENLFDPKIENLVKSTVFSVNGIVYNPRLNSIIDHIAIQDIMQKKIKFNCKKSLMFYTDLQAYRAIEMSNRLGYAIDDEILLFIKDILKKNTIESLFAKVNPHKSKVTMDIIKKIYNDYGFN